MAPEGLPTSDFVKKILLNPSLLNKNGKKWGMAKKEASQNPNKLACDRCPLGSPLGPLSGGDRSIPLAKKEAPQKKGASQNPNKLACDRCPLGLPLRPLSGGDRPIPLAKKEASQNTAYDFSACSERLGKRIRRHNDQNVSGSVYRHPRDSRKMRTRSPEERVFLVDLASQVISSLKWPPILSKKSFQILRC